MKYNFELDAEGNNSLSIIIKQLKKNTTVLEFGPANGRLTKYMKEELGCQVYLVEIDEQAGKDALRYGVDLVVGDIEQYTWMDRYKDIRFDHIIFADVLEHLRNPLKVMQHLRGFLKKDGTILLSVPNLAHNAVLIDLMNDKFRYNPIGLLDDTHIHLFTKNSLEEMIAESGFYVKKEMATYARVGTIEIQNTIEDVPGIKAAYWNARRYGQVYQYVYEVVQNPTETEKLIQEPEDDCYYLQVYFDENKQWTEEKSVIKTLVPLNKIQRITVSLPEKSTIFRIDPLNVSCMIRVHAVCGKVDNDTIQMQRICSNEVCISKDVYCFTVSDPMLLYQAETAVDSIVIEYEVLDVDIHRSTFKEGSFQTFFDDINELKEEKLELQGTEKHLEREKEQLIEEVNHWKAEYDSMKNTALCEKSRADALQVQREQLESRRIYKIYKFFKRK